MLDYEALEDSYKELEERASGGKNIVSLQKMDSGTSIFIRILPPTESLGKFFFFEEKGHWIDGERYVSPVTFGGKPVIEPIIEKARAEKDPDVLALMDAKEFNTKSYFYVPILLCELKFKGQDISKVTVVDGVPKILQANSTIIRRLIHLFTHRMAQNGTPNRLADREKGMFIEISKSGKKLNTEYTADLIPVPWEMAEEFYEDVPDVVEFVKEKTKPATELKDAIEAYLYGTGKKKSKRRDDDDDEEEPRSKKKRFSDEDEAPKRSRKVDDEDEEDEAPKRSRRKDDEEDEEPKPKKKRSARDFLDNEG